VGARDRTRGMIRNSLTRLGYKKLSTPESEAIEELIYILQCEYCALHDYNKYQETGPGEKGPRRTARWELKGRERSRTGSYSTAWAEGREENMVAKRGQSRDEKIWIKSGGQQSKSRLERRAALH